MLFSRNRLMIGAMAHLAMLSALTQPNGYGPRNMSRTRKVSYKHLVNLRLNRSRHWPYAETYQQARDMSPSTEPVR